jgi:hypothetical protein|tara:strand:+ start:69 stop:236 length:168 start_codon:yes stop_codon:yes gene_type:complete
VAISLVNLIEGKIKTIGGNSPRAYNITRFQLLYTISTFRQLANDDSGGKRNKKES